MRIIAILTILIFSFTRSTTSLVYAQASPKELDYLVLTNADTVYGKITSVKDHRIKFENQQKEKFVFEPDQVFRAYWQSKKKVYAPSYVEKGLEPVPGTSPQIFQVGKYYTEAPTFAEVLVDGEIMVYYVSNLNVGGGGGMMLGTGGSGTMLSVGFSKSKYAYALKKATGEVIEIDSNSGQLFSNNKKKRTITLGRLINDEPALFAEFQNEDKYNYDLFIKYIMRYNELQRTKSAPGATEKLFIY